MEKVDTKLCNIGGMTCDEDTELSYAFDSVRLHMQNVHWVKFLSYFTLYINQDIPVFLNERNIYFLFMDNTENINMQNLWNKNMN